MKKYTLRQLLYVVKNMDWYEDKDLEIIKASASKFEIKQVKQQGIFAEYDTFKIVDIFDKSNSLILSFAIKNDKYVNFITDYIWLKKAFRSFEEV